MRCQFNGLAEQIADRPDFGLLDDIINTQTGKPTTVDPLSLTISNPPTQLEVQTIVEAFNNLLDSLKRA